MRCSKHLTDEQLRSWAFSNKIFISMQAVWNNERRKPQDLIIVVNYAGHKVKGKLLWSQKKQDIHLIDKRIKELYRHYYETYKVNDKEIKV